jgi:hypothetical protein
MFQTDLTNLTFQTDLTNLIFQIAHSNQKYPIVPTNQFDQKYHFVRTTHFYLSIPSNPTIHSDHFVQIS